MEKESKEYLEMTLADLERISKALRQIKKARATWAKYKKASKEGRATAEQMTAAQSVLFESVRDSLEIASEASVGIAQFYGEEEVSAVLANDLIA